MSEADEKVCSDFSSHVSCYFRPYASQFDAELRSRKPEFGIRNLDDVKDLANRNGMELVSQEAPGGGTNLFLIFRFANGS